MNQISRTAIPAPQSIIKAPPFPSSWFAKTSPALHTVPKMRSDTLGSAALPATWTICSFIKKLVSRTGTCFYNPQALAAVLPARSGILITGTNLFLKFPCWDPAEGSSMGTGAVAELTRLASNTSTETTLYKYRCSSSLLPSTCQTKRSFAAVSEMSFYRHFKAL